MSDMGVLTSPKTYAGLAAFQTADAPGLRGPSTADQKSLDAVGCPDNVRRVLPPIKGAAALGLLSVRWFPGLARLTTAMLTLYFVLAVRSPCSRA